MGLFRPTVTVLFGRGSWYAAPPPPSDANAVYCVPCQGSTWSSANKYHGLGQTGISSNLGLMRIKIPGAVTITDIRVELTGVIAGGAGSTIAWSLNVNDASARCPRPEASGLAAARLILVGAVFADFNDGRMNAAPSMPRSAIAPREKNNRSRQLSVISGSAVLL